MWWVGKKFFITHFRKMAQLVVRVPQGPIVAPTPVTSAAWGNGNTVLQSRLHVFNGSSGQLYRLMREITGPNLVLGLTDENKIRNLFRPFWDPIVRITGGERCYYQIQVSSFERQGQGEQFINDDFLDQGFIPWHDFQSGVPLSPRRMAAAQGVQAANIEPVMDFDPITRAETPFIGQRAQDLVTTAIHADLLNASEHIPLDQEVPGAAAYRFISLRATQGRKAGWLEGCVQAWLDVMNGQAQGMNTARNGVGMFDWYNGSDTPAKDFRGFLQFLQGAPGSDALLEGLTVRVTLHLWTRAPAPRRFTRGGGNVLGVPAFSLGLGCYKPPVSQADKVFEKYLVSKQSIIVLKNKDHNCFVYSLVYLFIKALSHGSRLAKSQSGQVVVKEATWRALDGMKFTQELAKFYPNVRGAYKTLMRAAVKGKGKCLEKMGKVVCDYVGHPFGAPVNERDIQEFEEKLSILVRMYGLRQGLHRLRDVEDKREDVTYLHMIANNKHCHPIMTMTGLLLRSYYCDSCSVGYQNKWAHKSCGRNCFYCRTDDCPGVCGGVVWVNCRDCLRGFPGRECFEAHLKPDKKGISTCDKVHSCGRRTRGKKCSLFDPRWYHNEENHVCGDDKCHNCGYYDCDGCAMKVKAPKAHVKNVVYFDFECTQFTGVHEVTHVVASCLKEPGFVVFKPSGEDYSHVLGEFVEWLIARATCMEGLTAVAHNGGAYDFQFIYKWCLANNVPVRGLLKSGQKLKHLIIGDKKGVRLVDSIAFLSMPLSFFPKTFGLEEMKKGYFPHLFNEPCHFSYEGPYPDPHMYMADMMGVKAREKFLEWHEKKVAAEEVFHFEEDMLAYCKSDVDILERGFEVFRLNYVESTGVDPLAYVTIAGACMGVFRSTFLEADAVYPLIREDDAWLRRAFYGGRTQVFMPFVTARDGERIKYADVTSLYPWVNSTKRYPKGKREVLDFEGQVVRGEEAERLCCTLFGFMEVDVVCPSDLLMPLLPCRRAGRGLTFDLEPKSRQVYSSVELVKAVELGYRVTAVYKAMIWRDSTTELFKGYMDLFYLKKQQATGWGTQTLCGKLVETEEEKRSWVEWFNGETGRGLRYEDVEYNPGKRAVAKLCLNSLWGKMGQREVRKQTHIMDDTDVGELLSAGEAVHEIVELEDGRFEVVHTPEMEDAFLKKVPNKHGVCVSLAAMTTAHARLKLYEALEMLGERALYCDTDSVVYISKAGEQDVELGPRLGDWTDELEAGDYITEFVGCGPKSYGYVTAKGHRAVKCKGFTLNFMANASLNYESMKKMVLRYLTDGAPDDSGVTIKSICRIVRDKARRLVLSKAEDSKIFKTTLSLKGDVVVGDDERLRVLPFGWGV